MTMVATTPRVPKLKIWSMSLSVLSQESDAP